MDTLLGYVKNIGFFLILVSVVCNALPENSYKKYCKLFCGLVLVVLVMTPFNEILNYDGDISDIFINKSYQADLMELEARLKLQEEAEFDMVLSYYEESLKRELEAVALDEGLQVIKVDVKYIYTDESKADMQLEALHIIVMDNEKLYEEGQTDEINNENKSDNYGINLDEIHIDDIEINMSGGDNESRINELSPGDRPRVLKFIEKVAEMLGIETYMINVTMKQ